MSIRTGTTGSREEPLGVGLLGVGVVGSAVAGALLASRSQATAPGSRGLELRRAVVRDLSRKRVVPVELLTDDRARLLADEDVDIVVELMGGEEPARSCMAEALAAGKHVVTANKEALAKHGAELNALAEKNGVRLLYEASVGGGIPVIGPLSTDLLANKITSIRAIINGTTNYILTRMSVEGDAFQDVLSDAQALGFAEADPSSDVEGYDAMYKIAILARLAFRADVPLDAIYREGISSIDPVDIKNAARLGFTVKLLAVARDEGAGLLVRVHPALVPDRVPMAKVDGVLNVCEVEGDLVGPLWLQGRGAGAEATASAVLGDLIRIASDPGPGTARRSTGGAPALLQMDDHVCQYYTRLVVQDRPGVLAEVAGVLGDRGISIDSVIQMDSDPGRGVADIVLTTHPAREGEMQAAISTIRGLDAVVEVAGLLRVESYPDPS